MQKRNTSSVGRVLSGLAAGILASSVGFAGSGHFNGLSVIKTCPAFVAPGSVFQCTFSVQNFDDQHGVVSLSTQNTVPYPGGSTSATLCTQGGLPVTILGTFGSDSDTCTGSVTETAPACGAGDAFFADRVRADGQDEGTGEFVNGTGSSAVLVQACTPTPGPPTNTPTPIPTDTPTPALTDTPTHTPTDTPTPTTTPTPTATYTRTPGPPPFAGTPLPRTPRATKTPKRV